MFSTLHVAILKSHNETIQRPPLLKVEHTGWSLNIVFFPPTILESLPPLPRQHSAAIDCTDKILQANRSDCTVALR